MSKMPKSNPTLTAPISKEFKHLQVETRLVRSQAYDPSKAPTLSSPTSVSEFIKKALEKVTLSTRERFIVIYLTTTLHPVGIQQMVVGGRTGVQVYFDEVLRTAILTNADALILVHNHPSDISKPSVDDVDLTNRLRKALEPFEVRVLDHLIIGADSITSLLAEGKITAQTRKNPIGVGKRTLYSVEGQTGVELRELRGLKGRKEHKGKGRCPSCKGRISPSTRPGNYLCQCGAGIVIG